MRTLEQIKDYLAVEHGFADYLQIDMTDMEPSEKMDVKLIILENAINMYGQDQFKRGAYRQREKIADEYCDHNYEDTNDMYIRIINSPLAEEGE